MNQYTGDGIMALFGAPIAHEDHAQRACYAALHSWLRDELRRHAHATAGAWLRLPDPDRPQLRRGRGREDRRRPADGLHGPGVTVGTWRSAWSSSRRRAASIYVSPQTASFVEGYFDLETSASSRSRGAAAPIRVLRATRRRCAADASRRVPRAASPASSGAPMRCDPGGALHRATEGNGQVLGVVGEAGGGQEPALPGVRRALPRRREIRVRGALPGARQDRPAAPHPGAASATPFGITRHRTGDQVRARRSPAACCCWTSVPRGALPLVFDFLGSSRPGAAGAADGPRRRASASSSLSCGDSCRRGASGSRLCSWSMTSTGSTREAMPIWPQLVEAVDGTRTLLLVNFRPGVSRRVGGEVLLPAASPQPARTRGCPGAAPLALLGDDPSAGRPHRSHPRTDRRESLLHRGGGAVAGGCRRVSKALPARTVW